MTPALKGETMKIVSVAEMQQIERQADAHGLSYAQMMDNAGRGLAEAVRAFIEEPESHIALALVGPGNNGGDALVALAHLASWGWTAQAYLARPREDDPLVQRLLQAGGTVVSRAGDPDLAWLNESAGRAGVILDGLLGTGAKPPLRPELAELLDCVQAKLAHTSPRPWVVAVDCPSGVDCDTGAAPEQALHADLTVTMAAVKRGLLAYPAAACVGKLALAGIGKLDGLPAWEGLKRFRVDGAWVQRALPERPPDAHKGTFGTAVICAGSLNDSCAAWLAGMAAYRCGAGLVTLAAPAPLHAALAGQIPEATWLLLPHQDGWLSAPAAEMLRRGLERATALLIGPGWGQDAATAGFLAALLEVDARPASLPPLVADADGLKLLARMPGWPTRLPPESILTPHPGEMGVLTGLSTAEINANRLEVAERCAGEWGHVVVLKGAFTVIASPDGRTAINPVATPALARAGTGDVLAGLCAGLRAQGMPAFDAAAAAAYLHGAAGLLAAQQVGAASVLASDVLATLPQILRDVDGSDSLI